MEFLHLTTIRESLKLVLKHLSPVKGENIPVNKAGGRISFRDYFTSEDIPSFNRSTMDGYAVRASDTKGASPRNPSLLTLKGQVRINKPPSAECSEGESFYLPTGAMLPPGADAVVMIEKAQAVEEQGDEKRWVEVYTSVSPGENVISQGDDYHQGEMVISRGTLIRPQEVGLLAYLGIEEVEVFEKVKVVVFGSGDEIVPIEKLPKPPRIRDLNSYMLCAIFQEKGFLPFLRGILPDDEAEIKTKLKDTLKQYDAVVISGGTSKGLRDVMSKVLSELGEPGIISHGLTVRPGKPTLLGVVNNIPIIVLPGHPASCFMAAYFVALPILRYLGGYKSEPLPSTTKAILKRKLPSKLGLGEYFRVNLKHEYKKKHKNSITMAYPLLGESGLISTLVKADGLVYVAENIESLEEGEEVEVLLL